MWFGFSSASFVRIVRWAGVVSSYSSTIRWAKRVAISVRISARSCRSLPRVRKTSPPSRLPDSARIRSWAAQNSARSGSGGSEPCFSSSIWAKRRASRPAGLPRISWLRSGSWSRWSSIIASRSAGPSTSKKGLSPAAVEWARSSRSQISAQVPIQSSSYGARNNDSARSRRRRAVAGVVAMRRTRSASTPSAASRAKRRARASVLPVPGRPASSSGPSSCATARCCASARVSMVQR